jgi:hypothetical protein
LGTLTSEAREGLRLELDRAAQQVRQLRQQAGEALRGLKDLAGGLERPDGQPGGKPR